MQVLAQNVMSGDAILQLQATECFRKLLSKARNPPVAEAIQCGVVPWFVEFLKRSNDRNLQLEAAWVLTNITSGARHHTATVVEAGAIPILIGLLESPADDVREQAAWALGNVAGDGPDNRNVVLKAQALPPLLRLLNDHTSKAPML